MSKEMSGGEYEELIERLELDLQERGWEFQGFVHGDEETRSIFCSSDFFLINLIEPAGDDRIRVIGRNQYGAAEIYVHAQRYAE